MAKIACADNKPAGQTVVPRRYLQVALAKVPIRNIRWLGGKLGKSLREAGLETMGDIQPLEIDDLIPVVGGQAQWVKELAMGVCREEVAEKTIPKSASAIKTFREVKTFDKVLRQVSLCCTDLLEKIKEHLKEKEVFPISLHVNCRQVVWSRNAADMKENSFAKTLKMPSWDEYK